MRPAVSMRAQIGTLVLATSMVQLANGFFNTFISLRLAIEDFDPALTGLVLSSYFAGFTLAASRSGQIIERIGHIRAYAFFAALVIAATAMMPILIHPWPWLALRAVIGFGAAGIFVATESWLNAKVQASDRGRAFSVYMVGTFVALAIGQLLIGRIVVAAATAFNAIEFLFAMALVIVSTTRAEPPRATVSTTALPWGALSRAAPVAVAGAAISGLISSTFYALVPAYLQDKGVEQSTIALFMLVAVVGGLVFQVPVGRLSDRFDRLVVLFALAIGFAITAIVLVSLPRALPVILPFAALLGGFMSTLYPLCVANAHDRMPSDRVIVVSGRLILVSGIGSVIGPLIGTSIKTLVGIDGVFYLMAAAGLVLAVLALTRSLTSAAPIHLDRTYDILAPQAASLAHGPLGCPERPETADIIGAGEPS